MFKMCDDAHMNLGVPTVDDATSTWMQCLVSTDLVTGLILVQDERRLELSPT